MQKLFRPFLGIIMVLGLAACSAWDTTNEVEILNETNATGSAFTKQLADEYRSFANSEFEVTFDYADALHFARKGLAAAGGDNVMPEPVGDWNLLPAQMEELSQGRARLVSALDRGARDIAPVEAAIAQARFDCWIENEEDIRTNRSDRKKQDATNCKNAFLNAMSTLEGLVGEVPVAAPEPAPAPVAMEEPPIRTPRDITYLVFFDWDSSIVGSDGLNVLDAVADEMVKRDVNVIKVTGHADTSGADAYNDRLGMRRANNVKNILVEKGIDPAKIVVESRGEKELLVETADGVREPANRRANIAFE